MDPPAQRRASVRRTLGARSNALGQRRGPVPGAAVPRRAARLSTGAPGLQMPATPNEPRLSEVRWQPCFRTIPSRFPTIHLFERIADPADWDALYWLESLTNPRLRQEIGAIE